jgi:hypothetical protein
MYRIYFFPKRKEKIDLHDIEFDYFLLSLLWNVQFNDLINTIFSSAPTVGFIVSVVLDNTLDVRKATKDRGMAWWARFRTFRGDSRNEEFYNLPFNLNRFFPPSWTVGWLLQKWSQLLNECSYKYHCNCGLASIEIRQELEQGVELGFQWDGVTLKLLSMITASSIFLMVSVDGKKSA